MSPEERTPIEAGVERMQAAIEQNQQRQQAMIEQWTERTGTGWPPSRRERRRLERELRRQASGEDWQKRSAGQGVVFLMAAAVLAYMAMAEPHLWWMVFIALALGLAGIKRLARYSKSQPTAKTNTATVTAGEAQKQSRPQPQAAHPESQPQPQSAPDPTLARIDELCERLLSEVRRGPDILRDVVRRPEETVRALKEGCHALAKREQELRALVTPEDDARLLRERERLTSRLQAERDEVTRQRLQGALDALDEQRKQRAELLVSAGRMDAERTRLAFTLENLYTQVIRVRSADASSAEVAGKGLRQSLDRLGGEIGALAEALESVHAQEPGLGPVSPVSEAPAPSGTEPGAERSKTRG
jgi:hypothetical protein